MTRHRPSRKKPQPTPKSRPTPLPLGLTVAIVAVLLCGGIPFVLGKVIELNSPDPFDGGAYAYSAQRLLDGARLWVDEHSSALPGTLLCNVIGITLFGFGDTGPNSIQMLLQIGGFVMLFYAVRRVYGNTAAAVCTSLAAMMLSAPIVAKFGNVKEQFMIPFAVVSACALMLHETGGKKRWAVIAGAAALLPYYFKPTGIAVVIATGIYLSVKLIANRRQWKCVFMTVWLWILGAAVGLCFPLTLFIWQRDIGRFLTTVPVLVLETLILFAALGHVLFALVYGVSRHRVRAFLSLHTHTRRTVGLLIAAFVVVIAAAVFGVPFLVGQVQRVIDRTGLFDAGSYVGMGRQARSLAEQAPQVMRYYHAVGAITYGAAATLIVWVITAVYRFIKKTKQQSTQLALAGFLALWWLLDMALVWVSPHSYEQYYLPLCASGAMLIGWGVWRWSDWLLRSTNKLPALATAGVYLIGATALLFPVFVGFATSPDTGVAYRDARTGQPQRRRGFAQRLEEARSDRPAPWQLVGDHVRNHSNPDETLYVWGWVPGIYVRAERMAPVPRAYEAEMHVMPPQQLAGRIRRLVEQLEQNPPRFIVDSLKRHFPFDRPPFELWPMVPANLFGNDRPQLLGRDRRMIEAYEQAYSHMLEQEFDDAEAERFAAMKPFRDFVMTRYRPVGQFGGHRLFERID